ncbi:cation diffusion facilitator family transporter [Paratissierella segnis]|uniref:Cation transporter n=1 Tax=Paratissierella segnis TaxID=2763679 RepID=A0A926EPQ6_9FIRM|nr:cation diffusion facilitator family transporter [Paratissierella segnis]MBC8587448.1 cation transporter [Paratissierella segnis]
MEIVRYKEIQKVQFIIILLNIITSISKLFTGFIINSASMMADGFHSMTDALNNVAGMIGVYFAFQPDDERHPYGHRKFETMATLLISGLLLFTSLNLLKGAFERIVNPKVQTVTAKSFIIMIFSIIVNICVTTYERKKGKQLQSDFLISDATHTLSDVFVSISVLGTLIAVKLGLSWMDVLVSIFIALIIAKSSFDIVKMSANILCDAIALNPEDISNVVCEFDEVHSCHKIRSRGRADDIHLDLHVVAANDMSLDKAHSLVHNIEKLLKSRFPGVTDVNVHVDPLDYYMNKSANK